MQSTITITGKLESSLEDRAKLEKSIKTYREVCNFISEIAHEENCFYSAALHHLTYKTVRIRFNLPSNLVIRAREKVVAVYKHNRKKIHKFKALSMDLDNRLISVDSHDATIISIATIEKRVKSKIIIESSLLKYLKYPIIKAKLTLRSYEFYLEIVVRNIASDLTSR